ncbi:GNAT family N-acetyltransferase [uncultured Kocuria sp.]|uniref:bifunctional acetate--CoA ligase family protein/GNAT family N-acetyltransferase n=1 Tax=uncultured Kocuria sp. TaxID=259305 RepID=UPI0026028216|nr:GNAT family N-acetyltransferase [uncultured Kocuria sp.]
MVPETADTDVAGQYPEYWEADVILRDGATAQLRPISPEDRDALLAFHQSQSENTIYLRFFSYKPTLSARELDRFTRVDHRDRVCFVLLLGEQIIGVGRYDRTDDPQDAEVAFMISDAHQGRGIGSILLEHLAAAARENGIDHFSAEVLPENRKMLRVFAEAGYELTRKFDDGVVVVGFDIDPTERSLAVMAAREHRAEALSMADLLSPSSIAVIGASRDPGHAGHALVEHLIASGFSGRLSGVSPTPFEREGMTHATSIGEVPERVDLAVVAVPVDQVADVVDQCGAAGVRAVVVVTGGYAEAGTEGRARQTELVRRARSYGMRVVGPASLGLYSTSPESRFNASILPRVPREGPLGLFSQSGAIGMMLNAAALRHDLGVSTYLSAGNRADVSGNDMMQYWEDDSATRACGLYLQSVGNPRKFSRIARRLSLNKPVIVAKSEVTGLRLPPGHTGRTTQAPPGALDAMFRQAGVIRADTSEHLMDVAGILAGQPLPAGGRTALVSNALALGQLMEDRCMQLGLDVAVTQAGVRTADGGDEALEALRAAVDSCLGAEAVDAAVVTLMPIPDSTPEVVAELVGRVGREHGKTVVVVFTGSTEPGAVSALHHADDGLDVPCFDSPGAALRALAKVVDYTRWRAQDQGRLAEPKGIDAEAAETFVETVLPRVSGDELLELDADQARALLETYGIGLLPSERFTDPEDAPAAAERLGYPVALKTTDPNLRHRLDLGGVQLNIQDDGQLRTAIETMHRALAPFGTFDLEVQAMAPTGQAVVLRAIEDPLIGPVLSFGMAGDAVNLLEDWAHRVPPLTDQDVRRMVREPKASRKLFGHQGVPAADVDRLEDLVSRVALLKDRHPEIARVELNPVLVSSGSLTVLAASVGIGNARQRTDSARRAMRS